MGSGWWWWCVCVCVCVWGGGGGGGGGEGRIWTRDQRGTNRGERIPPFSRNVYSHWSIFRRRSLLAIVLLNNTSYSNCSTKPSAKTGNGITEIRKTEYRKRIRNCGIRSYKNTDLFGYELLFFFAQQKKTAHSRINAVFMFTTVKHWRLMHKLCWVLFARRSKSNRPLKSPRTLLTSVWDGIRPCELRASQSTKSSLQGGTFESWCTRGSMLLYRRSMLFAKNWYTTLTFGGDRTP